MKTKPKRIFVISGPSGSGKTTLVARALADKTLSRRLGRSISYTTRPKRSGERSKRDYIFISEDNFKRKLKAKKILEWTNYLGYYYGTPLDFAERQLKKKEGALLCLDKKGALKLRKLYPKNTVTIFVKPSSLQHLPKRIQKRCKATCAEEIQKRFKLAQEEIKAAQGYDYYLVNRDLGRAVKELTDIIINEMEDKR